VYGSKNPGIADEAAMAWERRAPGASAE